MHSAQQRQKAVTAPSEQLLPFVFTQQYCTLFFLTQILMSVFWLRTIAVNVDVRIRLAATSVLVQMATCWIC